MNPKFNESSGVRFWSLGIVVEDKIDDGDIVKVTPIEEMTQVLGALNDVAFDYDVNGKNHQGIDVSSTIKGVAWVVAKWKNFGGDNRLTAPNVYGNETVLLIKYANDEQVYWHKVGREPAFRRLENVIYGWSNLEEKGEEADLETSIWLQVSTREQRLQLHIPNNRTEKAGYDVTFDMVAGTFEFKDTEKNTLFIDSVNGDLRVDMNRSIELNAPEIRINGKEYVHTTTKELKDEAETIVSKASTSVLIEGGTAVTIKSGGTLLSEAGGVHTVKGAGPVIVTPGIAVG